MRRALYVILIGAALLAPVERVDVAKLLPVEAVAVYGIGELVVIETDSGDKGEGKDSMEALANLRQNCSSIIYLDTARYLLVEEGLNEEAQKLMQEMKRSVKVEVYRGGSVKETVKYLEAHQNAGKPQTEK